MQWQRHSEENWVVLESIRKEIKTSRPKIAMNLVGEVQINEISDSQLRWVRCNEVCRYDSVWLISTGDTVDKFAWLICIGMAALAYWLLDLWLLQWIYIVRVFEKATEALLVYQCEWTLLVRAIWNRAFLSSPSLCFHFSSFFPLPFFLQTFFLSILLLFSQISFTPI